MAIALGPSADAADLTPQAQFDADRAAAERVAPTDIARSALSQPQQRDAVDYVLSTQEGRLPASPLRQFRNAKGSIDPLDLAGQMLDDFGQVCAVILARRHTRTLHPSALRGYLKGAKELDEALAAYAQDCADQVERDRADLLAGPGARRVRRPVRVTSRRRHAGWRVTHR